MGKDRGAGPAGDDRTQEEIDEDFRQAFRNLAELRESRLNPQGRDAVVEQMVNAGTREEIRLGAKEARAEAGGEGEVRDRERSRKRG